MKKSLLCLAAAGLFFTACSSDKNGGDADSVAIKMINDSSFAQHLQVLASDEFMGRKPFTEGETKSINYLKTQFSAMGLKPGNGDSYFQDVPMVEIKSQPNAQMVFSGPSGTLTANYLTAFVAATRRVQPEVSIQNSPLVFAGYGIVAPEYKWNDYAGLDVKGKTVVVMINDPGFADSTLFKGKNMTYYGRWTYKFEEAARQGATGILIIHDTAPAAYPWSVVRSGWSKSKLQAEEKDNNMSRAVVEGWISMDIARQLFSLAGQSEQLFNDARKPGFKAVDLKLTTSLKIRNTIKKSVSHNVVAVIPGIKRPEENIIYSAHWDHLGIGEPIKGDSIYNGAVDNATGVAALLELAAAFQKLPVKPERSIVFVSFTAEEQGLLGSEYYAKHPVYPVNKTVADINMDMMGLAGKTKDVIIFGYGQSDLEDYAAVSAKKQGRVIVKDPVPSTGLYYRSDHFNFAKVGIPSLFTGSGVDNVAHGREWGLKQAEEFTKSRYHSPQDEFSAIADRGGMVEDVRMLFDLGYRLSNESSFPQWKTGSEFKAARERSLKK
jgi:Zn-dependent M28 family amino/carboxypeptidase